MAGQPRREPDQRRAGHQRPAPPAHPGAAIINIGSIAADKGAGAYGAAKTGLASWTVDLAAQLGPDGITANTLAPGYVADTEFFRDRLDDTARQAMADAAAAPARPTTSPPAPTSSPAPQPA